MRFRRSWHALRTRVAAAVNRVSPEDDRRWSQVVDGNELAWVRLELDILVSSRTIAPLTVTEEARYLALSRRERELLGVEPDGRPSGGHLT